MNEKELEQQNLTIVEQSQEIVVFSKEDNESANELLKRVMDTKKAVNSYWKEPIEKANQTHKTLTAKRNEMLNPINMAETRIKEKIGEYLTKERKERERQERELREEADRIERERLAEIAKKQKELEEAEGYLSPEEIAKEKARIEEENKKKYMPEVKVEKEEAPKGQISKILWRAEVVDKNLVPEMYKIVDQSALDKIAVGSKGKANVPGVKFYSKVSVSTR